MRKGNKKIELLAPAGNLEKMHTAFAFGADAVYAGIPDFSLRVRINNFDLQGLRQAATVSHELGKKLYVTVNIFAHNCHLEKLPLYIKELKKIGVDGLIVSDPGVLDVVKHVWPESVIHLSTQANCTNWQSAAFWYKAGVKRVILGREVTLAEIREIRMKVPKLEIEYFVHGAMCMAYSGRCFLSKYYRDRSANLGDCVQPCRWKYDIESAQEQGPIKTDEKFNESVIIRDKEDGGEFELVEEEHGSYILNSKDLCLIEFLDMLADAGVTSFKIEGRAKSVYYLGVVIGAYRKAIETIVLQDRAGKKRILSGLKRELEDKLVHRGYTEGFLLGGKADQNLKQSHSICAWEFCGQAFAYSAEHEEIKAGRGKYVVPVKVHNTLKKGDLIEIVLPGYDIIKMKVGDMFDLKTGEKIIEAHGGQGSVIGLSAPRAVPELSVIRRKKI